MWAGCSRVMEFPYLLVVETTSLYRGTHHVCQPPGCATVRPHLPHVMTSRPQLGVRYHLLACQWCRIAKLGIGTQERLFARRRELNRLSQGVRAWLDRGKHMSVFAVSKVRLDSDGCLTHVLWGVVDTKSNQWVSPEVVAPVVEVVDAIQKGDHVVALFPTAFGHVPGPQFTIADNAGELGVTLQGPIPPERQIHIMDKLDS